MKMLVEVYKDEIKAGLGRASGNFMACGGYRFGKGEKLFENGVIYNHDFNHVTPFDESKITEEASRAWYVSNDPKARITSYNVCYTKLLRNR